jgi:hypothetical protein
MGGYALFRNIEEDAVEEEEEEMDSFLKAERDANEDMGEGENAGQDC